VTTEPEQTADDPAAPLARAQDISQLFQEHNRALISFILRHVRNEQEARDVAQEAYVRLLQLEQPVAISYLRFYLFRVARNIAVDHYRQRMNRARLDLLATPPPEHNGSAPESSAIAAEELARLSAAIHELPDYCRRAFLLHKLQGLSTTAIAANMQISDRMVRHHIRRALIYCRLRCDGVPATAAMRSTEP
jgi:RNA polymerase sigma factor (sigma-70 family)